MMREDRVLRDVARLDAEEEREERARVRERWLALTAGTLEPEEEARLRAAAGRSEEDRGAFEIFRPLGARFRARTTRDLCAMVAGADGAAGDGAGPVETEARVLSFPGLPSRLRLPRWSAVAAAFAAAAVGLLWLGRPGAGPLPAYGLSLDGIATRRSGVETVESVESAAESVLAPDAGFRILLQPEREVSGPVDARFFVVREGRWRSWPVELEAASSGSLRVEERLVGDLQLEPGAWTLVVAVGRPAALPSADEVRDRFESGEEVPEGAGWQLYSTSFRVEP